MKPAQAVAKGVVAEGALGADPVHQTGIPEISLQALKAWETKYKGVKKDEENAGGRDVRLVAIVAHATRVLAESEAFVEIRGKRRETVRLCFQCEVPEHRARMYRRARLMTETLLIRIDSETKRRLDALCKRARRSKSFLAAEAIAAYVESEEWQLGEIHAGIAEIDSGKTVTHEKVSKWLKSWGKRGELKAPR